MTPSEHRPPNSFNIQNHHHSSEIPPQRNTKSVASHETLLLKRARMLFSPNRQYHSGGTKSGLYQLPEAKRNIK